MPPTTVVTMPLAARVAGCWPCALGHHIERRGCRPSEPPPVDSYAVRPGGGGGRWRGAGGAGRRHGRRARRRSPCAAAVGTAARRRRERRGGGAGDRLGFAGRATARQRRGDAAQVDAAAGGAARVVFSSSPCLRLRPRGERPAGVYAALPARRRGARRDAARELRPLEIDGREVLESSAPRATSSPACASPTSKREAWGEGLGAAVGSEAAARLWAYAHEDDVIDAHSGARPDRRPPARRDVHCRGADTRFAEPTLDL